MKTIADLAREYGAAYGLAYRWLFAHCAPWRWLLSAALWPGSPAVRAAQSIRARAL